MANQVKELLDGTTGAPAAKSGGGVRESFAWNRRVETLRGGVAWKDAEAAVEAVRFATTDVGSLKEQARAFLDEAIGIETDPRDSECT